MTVLKRIELKFPLYDGALQLIEEMLVNNVPSLLRPYPDRTIQSVYWDNPNQQDYFDNVAGTTPRTKVRLRWYNDDKSSSAIEIKEKNIRVSWKHVLPIGKGIDVDAVLRDPMRACNLSNGTAVFKNALIDRINPVLHVKYDRKYFTAMHGIRFTIDSNIRFANPAHEHMMTISPVPGVLEIKFPLEMELQAAAYARRLNLQYYRHSKYVIGMDCIYY